jgi:hypothetical protein
MPVKNPAGTQPPAPAEPPALKRKTAPPSPQVIRQRRAGPRCRPAFAGDPGGWLSSRSQEVLNLKNMQSLGLVNINRF